MYVITCGYEPPPREADLSHCGLYLRLFRLLSVPKIKTQGKLGKLYQLALSFLIAIVVSCQTSRHFSRLSMNEPTISLSLIPVAAGCYISSRPSTRDGSKFRSEFLLGRPDVAGAELSDGWA